MGSMRKHYTNKTMKTAGILRHLGLLETLCFKFSVENGRYGFRNTHKYYIDIAARSRWGSMR